MARKLFSFFLFVLCLAVLPLSVMAQEFEPDRLGSISVTLVSQDGAKPMVGAELSVFYVATVESDASGTLRYTYTDAFAGCSVALDDPELVKVLEKYISGNRLPAQKIVTDEKGNAICKDLPLGLYFVQQTGAVAGFAPCTPFLVTIPYQIDDNFRYDVDASPKTDVARLVSITVRKVWNTDKSTAIPSSITVQLLCHDELVGTEILNEQNNWQAIFADLPESDGYRIQEVNIPKGFTATYNQKGYSFTVTNTASLAQTGQLIWPIPVLAAAGLFFLLMGFAILRKAEKYDA